MKTIKSITIILLIAFSNTLTAQFIDDCEDGNIDLSGLCGELTDYIPSSNTSIKTFNVNIHICRPNNAGGIYGNVNNQDVNTLISNVNTIFSNIQTPVLPVSPPAALIVDSRIRFHLDNVIYHDDDTYYEISSGSAGNYHYDFLKQNPATVINIFFFKYSDYSIA